MTNGKIRHSNHIVDSKAIQFLQNFFPIEWIARTIQPDYGLDLDLELFDYEDEQCVTLGEHVFLQVKGTENPSYSKSHLFGPEYEAAAFDRNNAKIDVINYSLEVSTLNLVERMGSCIPVLLVLVDLKSNNAYYVCLNDYIRHVLPYQAVNYKSQGHVMIHIPTENSLSVDAIRWYGKRIKVYSLLQEILAVADDCQCLLGTKLIEKASALIFRIQDNDAWNAQKYWGFMQLLYKRMQELIENGMYDHEAESYVRYSVENSDNWKYETLFEGFDGRTESGLTLAKEISCRKFLELCSATLSTFENEMRQWGLPTCFWWGIRHMH